GVNLRAQPIADRIEHKGKAPTLERTSIRHGTIGNGQNMLFQCESTDRLYFPNF
ncbi:hypothetical protein ALC62_12941, partial [Cyphomyrmex costatus]